MSMPCISWHFDPLPFEASWAKAGTATTAATSAAIETAVTASSRNRRDADRTDMELPPKEDCTVRAI